MARRRRYRTTAKQVAASRRNLEKARKSRRRRRVAAVAATGVALGSGALVARHKLSGSTLSTNKVGPLAKNTRKVSAGHGRQVSRRGLSVTYRGHKQGPLGDTRVVNYEHKKLTRDVMGRHIGNARNVANDVMARRPPNAVQRRRLNKFNTAHTEDAKAASAIRFGHTTGQVPTGRPKFMPKPKVPREIINDENLLGSQVKSKASGPSIKRGRGFQASNPHNAPGSISGNGARRATAARGTTNPQAGRRISQDEVLRRTNSYMESLPRRKQTARRRRMASQYYAGQPLYTGSGTSGRRGRARSRELKNRKR